MFSEMMKCIVGVFNGDNIEIYGLQEVGVPTILLKKSENVFSTVVSID